MLFHKFREHFLHYKRFDKKDYNDNLSRKSCIPLFPGWLLDPNLLQLACNFSLFTALNSTIYRDAIAYIPMDTTNFLDLKRQQEIFDTNPNLVTIGPINSARMFDGLPWNIPSAEYPCISNPINCYAGLTMAFWINILRFQGNETFVLSKRRSPDSGITIKVITREARNFLQIVITADRIRCKVQSNLTTAIWTHVAFTWRLRGGGEIVLFLNGRQSPEVSSCDSEGYPDGILLWFDFIVIGSQDVVMMLDDVALWDRPLNFFEVFDLIHHTTTRGKMLLHETFWNLCRILGPGVPL